MVCYTEFCEMQISPTRMIVAYNTLIVAMYDQHLNMDAQYGWDPHMKRKIDMIIEKPQNNVVLRVIFISLREG